MATEKRLIDANAIPYQKCYISDNKEPWLHKIVETTFKTDIDQMPTVDAVEVVRCKDCKHNEDCIRRIQFWGRNPVLELNTTEYHPLDFCSYGERKDNE